MWKAIAFSLILGNPGDFLQQPKHHFLLCNTVGEAGTVESWLRALRRLAGLDYWTRLYSGKTTSFTSEEENVDLCGIQARKVTTGAEK